MTGDTIAPGDLEAHLLQMFPPILRIAVLEEKTFRDDAGLRLDAVIRLNDIGVSCSRSILFEQLRRLMGGDASAGDVLSVDRNILHLTFDPETRDIVTLKGGKRRKLPDFSSLHPDKFARLEWFDKEVSKFGINDDHMHRWRAILIERALDDEEVDVLLNEFRLTPQFFEESVRHVFRQPEMDVATLVPQDIRYFERLVGQAANSMTLSQYHDRVCKDRIEEAIRQRGVAGLDDALRYSSHPAGPKAIPLSELPRNELVEYYHRIAKSGARFAQVGAIECGLANLRDVPELERPLAHLIGIIQSDHPNGAAGRLLLTSSLIMMVDAELARTGICRDLPPFWRRMAAIAHASVLEQAFLAVGMDIEEFGKWTQRNRVFLFRMQSYVDMRLEPRWRPEFMSPRQLKAEMIGRIMVLANDAAKVAKSQELKALLTAGSPNSIPDQIDFPAAFFPGPLEGGVPPVDELPKELEALLAQDLEAEELNTKSFVGLVNSSLLYRFDPDHALRAARALEAAKYRVRGLETNEDALELLGGLAHVAAVTRRPELASAVRVLMRVIRRTPDFKISISHSVCIGLVASAAHAEQSDWAEFVGQWLTELAFDELANDDGIALQAYISVLRPIAPMLWMTTARGDAAISAFLLSVGNR